MIFCVHEKQAGWKHHFRRAVTSEAFRLWGQQQGVIEIMTDSVGFSSAELSAIRCALTNLVLELRGVEQQNHAAVGELGYDKNGNITTIPNAIAVAMSTRAISRATIHAEELADMLGCDVAPVV
jgi:hypothetical protein